MPLWVLHLQYWRSIHKILAGCLNIRAPIVSFVEQILLRNVSSPYLFDEKPTNLGKCQWISHILYILLWSCFCVIINVYCLCYWCFDVLACGFWCFPLLRLLLVFTFSVWHVSPLSHFSVFFLLCFEDSLFPRFLVLMWSHPRWLPSCVSPVCCWLPPGNASICTCPLCSLLYLFVPLCLCQIIVCVYGLLHQCVFSPCVFSVIWSFTISFLMTSKRRLNIDFFSPYTITFTVAFSNVKPSSSLHNIVITTFILEHTMWRFKVQ